MEDTKEYVCGFLFFNQTGLDKIPIFNETSEQKVLLILKNRPVWQAGNYNGIGGKIEIGETPIEAMVRECYEESGLNIAKWTQYAIINGPKYRVYFFKAFAHEVPQWQQKTSEPLAAFPLSKLPQNLIQSNRYLIPLALHNIATDAVINVTQ